MADQQQGNQFNTRADNAALALRQDLLGRGAKIPESGAVPVGPDGQPQRPLPPEGSYERMALEEQQRAQQQQIAAQALQAAPAPTAEQPQQLIGQQPSLEPRQLPQQDQPPQGTPPPAQEEVSPNAQRRISELSTKLRDQEQQHQQAAVDAQARQQSEEALRGELEALKLQHRQMLESNLDNLDPESRLMVMQQAQIQEALAQQKREILSELAPALTNLQQQSAHSEMLRVAGKYPAFDVETHVPLIEMFRESNPRCSIEQAFRAVAETPEELRTVGAAPAQAVPPIIPPGNGPTSRYSMPEQQPQRDPEQELREDARRIRELRSSQDPADHREGLRAVDRNLAARLSHMLPGQ